MQMQYQMPGGGNSSLNYGDQQDYRLGLQTDRSRPVQGWSDVTPPRTNSSKRQSKKANGFDLPPSKFEDFYRLA